MWANQLGNQQKHPWAVLVANTQKNPKEECKVIFTRSQIRRMLREKKDEGGMKDISTEEGENCLLYTISLCVACLAPFLPRKQAHLSTARSPLMHREGKGKLGATLGQCGRGIHQWKEGKVGVLSSCEGFSNVPLMGTRGCINYNHVLTIRQLGYPMRGAPSEESITPFIAWGFSDPNARVLQEVQKAWGAVQSKDKELRGSNNGITGGYHKWLRVQTQELDWLPKLKGCKRGRG